MNTYGLSVLLASLVTAAIGASVLLRDRTRRTYTSFAAFVFMVSLWHLFTFISTTMGSPVFGWLALWPAATIPPTAVRFFRYFLAEPAIGGKHRPPRVTLAWTIACYVALVYSAFDPIHQELWFSLPFGAYVFGGLYRCVYDLYVQYRATVTRVEKTRIRYLMVGGFVATTLALTDSLPRFGITWPTVGNMLTILYLYFLSQTLFRYRLLDLHELFGKMVVLGTLVVLLSATYGLLLTWVGGGQEGLFLLNTLVASFVILILFEPIRSRLENSINRWLIRERNELRNRLANLRRELSNVVSVPRMVRRMMSSLEESRRLTDASLYLIDSDGAGYDLYGYVGHKPIERLEAAPLRRFLDRVRDDYITLELLDAERRELERAGDKHTQTSTESLDAIARVLQDMHASLVVPILGAESTEQGPWLIGVLGVRDERVDEAFSMDDIDMFKQLAAQAAITVENSQVYERMKERDRLATIGEMSAGLAHEIRNPLGAIKGAAQLLVAPDGQPIDAHDAGDFIQIIVEEVDRLNNVVSQFLDYARPGRTDPTEGVEIDLNDVLQRMVALLENQPQAANVDVQLKLDDLMPPVEGDPEQLRQVFLNLALNALQAMPDGGTLEILTTRRRRTRLGYGSFAEVRFRDTGPGIDRDKVKKLFIPFYTTKERGTGLGLAISQRIVTTHGGTIEVRSRPGHGATFSVFLPALGPSRPPRSVTQTDRHLATTQPVRGFRADLSEDDGPQPSLPDSPDPDDAATAASSS